ncbi:malto-oligosyltrehalose synthase [Mucilaginibacter sp. RS28]|uniref:4-alpha-glucanotransferase n=1 Tax=Mucilaginibacter straminoryzae TaxID=2932774 RepID=A0A9X1X4Q6_9SPHI|nr:malto-oligosyltrehalose synthase [Mucilaginibacter straminoryzae]MCJ8210941.1 malto-oligosyltrehalose synthase [Mucilaginibacter straminoryzae]
MFNPVATYRIQFHQQFTFAEFEKIISYLQKLGVSTIYASPIFEATPGSTHGYDGINPHHINPEIGTEKQLKAISKKLSDAGMGWLQDIVPNHMGVHEKNPWLMDLLEKGKRSLYAGFFDTGIASDLFQSERLMIPVLGGELSDVLEKQELQVAYQDRLLVLKYYDNFWPLNPQSYQTILNAVEIPDTLKSTVREIDTVWAASDNKKLALRWAGWLSKFNQVAEQQDAKDSIEDALNNINNNPELLKQVIDSQFYRPCNWQETDKDINFRRFFTVNSLICLNIQDPEVFSHYHSLIKTLVDKGIFQGLRIDHIDGLYDPENYLHNLRELAGDETYIVAEKILERGENMPSRWALQGNTGYDFLAQVNNLLTDESSERKFTSLYNRLIGKSEPVEQQIHQKKTHILETHMQGELNNLAYYFVRLKLADQKALKTVGLENIKNLIAKILIHCPVYRFYGNAMPLDETETASVRSILSAVLMESPSLQEAANLFDERLLQKPHENSASYNDRALKFYQRLMQFSGPLMAKGVEDTLMYTYNRFVGHNEVGDAPDAFGIDVKEFHRLMRQRQKQWPLSINGTSTHDTKRGEDVRARLNALSAMPGEWADLIKQWQKLERNWDSPVPDVNDRYLIYQTIAGAYPMPGQPEDNFGERIKEYLTKALREAKTNSDWTAPNEEYENATLDFATSLLDQQGEFWQSFVPFHQQLSDHGIVNSLAQVLLKFTCPGVPDVYHGCELWDLSLVDPDNRRPVDYDLRNQLLHSKLAEDNAELLSQLWQDRYNGHIKLWLTQQLFKLRSEERELFTKGNYIPLKVKGAYQDNVIAFARRYQKKWLIVATGLYTAAICKEQNRDITEIDWKNTRLIIPEEAPESFKNTLTSVEEKVNPEGVLLSQIFGALPMAILELEYPENDRGAGILMHITSLPSNFGIGDLGPGARTFANFLSKFGQKYWQLLPLNPTEKAQSYSPYSSISSMAGNTLLISPVLLAKDGLIGEEELENFHLQQTDSIDFENVEDLKQQLFDKVYQKFTSGNFKQLQQRFKAFCEKEAYWLNDFALYSVVKNYHEGDAWYEWPKSFKSRNEATLNRFAERNAEEINKIKWLQFIFFRQWQQLKDYCRVLNIQLFGDLPFYISYDSVDVWANQHLFAVDKNGKMTGVAGVPSDYFNENGQLWGMPVYNWQAMKREDYCWWINRLKKNMELFDLVRLDHFRAFSAYWEVPAGEETAKNGKWVKGPGSDFFTNIKEALGNVRFVAEDLGDIDQPVWDLRDEFNLPGMKVLQFAWGDTMAQSIYIPHNYDHNFLVYTGTHDNNTTVGWFNQDTDDLIKEQIETYTGMAPKAKNIHRIFIRLAYASTAKVAIAAMQDVLGLDENSRMNNPSTTEGNWLWRLMPKLVTDEAAETLIKWVRMYNRQ